MAVGRLKKETNPLPGYEPGFLPQHERADGEFQTTGENHPLPTGNYMQTNSGVWIPQKGSDDGAAHVQLTGSLVKEIIVDREHDYSEWNISHSSVILADQPPDYFATSVDVRDYRKITLVVENKTNFDFLGDTSQSKIVARFSGGRITTGGLGHSEFQTPAIPAGGEAVFPIHDLLSEDWGKLPLFVAYRFEFSEPADSSERSGAVRWMYIGEK